MLKLIKDKDYSNMQQEMRKLKEENDFFRKGYRALSQCLDYQNAIVAILKTQNIKEIEINNNLLYTVQDEIEVLYTHNHTTKIRIKEEK